MSKAKVIETAKYKKVKILRQEAVVKKKRLRMQLPIEEIHG